MSMTKETVLEAGAVARIARRTAKPGCSEAYEALVRSMIEDARSFPGFLVGSLLPPSESGGEYQVVMRFATEQDLRVWDASQERAAWHEKLRAVAEGDPDYQMLTGLEAWFAPAVVPVSLRPPRWRMTLLSWMGIFPTVSLLLWLVAPLLAPLPFLARTAVLTGMVALLMAYVVMPRLTKAMTWFLQPKK